MMLMWLISCHYSCAMRVDLFALTGNWGGFYLITFFSTTSLCSCTCWRLKPLWRWHGSISISKHRSVCSTNLSLSSPSSPPTAAKLQQCLHEPSWRAFLCQNCTCWRLASISSNVLCVVLLVPSHPNAVVAIPGSSPGIRHNTVVSFSFTPHSRALPYKYSKKEPKHHNWCSI